jgi:hypothetical protein
MLLREMVFRPKFCKRFLSLQLVVRVLHISSPLGYITLISHYAVFLLLPAMLCPHNPFSALFSVSLCSSRRARNRVWNRATPLLSSRAPKGRRSWGL